MAGVEIIDYVTAKAAASKIRDDIGIETVVITLGDQGAWIEGEGISELLNPFQVDVVATVAAGDAFNGGLGVGLASGMDLLEAARLGMASGALCVSKPGAQDAMATRQEAEALLSSDR